MLPPSMSDSEIITAIRTRGWLQGDLVGFNELTTLGAFRGGGRAETPFQFAVLLSHSCNVQNPRYEKVPHIEWVGVRAVSSEARDKLLLNALNPRALQVQLNDELCLEFQIGDRFWTERRVLASLSQDSYVSLSAHIRKTLMYWIAHSYTRIATPDSLDRRLKFRRGKKEEGLGVEIDKFLKNNNDKIHSAWISVDPWDELNDGDAYDVSFVFLASDRRAMGELQAALDQAVERASLDKVNLREPPQVLPLEAFTALDIEQYARYNRLDWLSLDDEE